MAKRPDYTVPEGPSAESLAEIPALPDEAWEGAVRGLAAARQKWGGSVRIDKDLRERFPTEQAVNDALRAFIEVQRLLDQLIQKVQGERAEAIEKPKKTA